MNPTAEVPREKLREIIARNGVDRILEDSERCEGLLKDYCGEHRREVSALVGALEERVPMELRSSWQSAMTPEAMRARLVQRLRDNRGLAPEIADWAVDTWSYALGVGLGRSSDRLASNVMGVPPLPPPPPPPAQGQWVGSQVISNPAPLPPPSPAAQMYYSPQAMPPPPPAAAVQKPASGMALKAVGAALLLAIVGYFGAPALIKQFKTDDKPCVNRDPNGTCLDGQSVVNPKKEEPKVDPTPVKEEPVKPVVKTPTAIVAIGTQISVRVATELSSKTATEGQYVDGVLAAPLMSATKQVLPAGAKVVLQVRNVDTAGRLIGVPQLTLNMHQATIGGRTYELTSSPYTVKGPSRTVNTVKKGGIGGAIGCGVGAVTGVFTRKPKKGCGIGAAGGAAVGTGLAASDEIKPAVIPADSVINFILRTPLTVE